MGFRRITLAAVSLLALPGIARAADTSTLGTVEVHPNLTTFGVYADVTGDDDADAKAWVEYREAGTTGFTKGHELMRIAPGRFAGAVFYLGAGKSYDVRVVLDDPDNGGAVNQDTTVATRAGEPAAASGTTLWVDAQAGSDGNPGTQAAPLATIQAAADKAQPGDTVRVKPGVYHESVDPPNGGTEGKPIWFVADGSGVIVDGSDPTLEKPTFTNEGGDLYSTAFSGASEYVAADDVRLYDYPSLAELTSGTTGVSGGFYVGNGKLYVRLPNGGDPSSVTLHVAVRNTGFLLDTLGHVVVDGFELRYFGGNDSGAAIDVRDTHHAWVRNNQMHHSNGGVRVRRSLASANVIEHNTFRDTSVWGWPWDAVKAHTPEASAISVTDGRGNVVRYNQTEGSFNGIYVGQWGTTDEAIAKDTDVYGNVMKQHGDDGLEPEGACVNVRFWHNVIAGVHNGISVAPIEVGPAWFVRNLVVDYKAHVYKVNNGSTGWILAYHTTGVPMAGEADAQAVEPTEPFGPFVSRNNIYQAHRYAIENGLSGVNAGVSFDYDDLFTDDPGRFVKWLNVTYPDITALKASGTIEPNGFQVAPSYENPTTLDYNLTAGHALIDQGVLIDGINSELVVGAGPDVGAFERGGVSPLTDATPSGGSGGTGGGGGTAGSGASAGTGGGGANPPGTGGSGANAASGGDDGGCGCRTRRGSSDAALLLAALGLVLGLERRGRKRRVAAS